MHYLKVRGLIC